MRGQYGSVRAVLFTGIVEALGRVRRVAPAGTGLRRVTIATKLPLKRAKLGSSVAVNGVCLTVVKLHKHAFAADLGPETLAVSTLGNLDKGGRVHLERPLRAGDELGGHLVSGHVDGVGIVKSTRKVGEAWEITIAAPSAVSPLLAPKGSITVDGVSLTINAVKGSTFSVLLIPHTLAVTTLGERKAGDPVNLEADLIAKHIRRLVQGSDRKL